MTPRLIVLVAMTPPSKWCRPAHQAPGAWPSPIAQNRRVGQSLIVERVIVWSGAYCGWLWGGRADFEPRALRRQAEPRCEELRRDRSSVAEQRLRSAARRRIGRCSAAAPCPARPWPEWALQRPAGRAPAPWHLPGNGWRSLFAPPGESASRRRRPACHPVRCRRPALARRGFAATALRRSSACGRCKAARPCASCRGSERGAAPAWWRSPSSALLVAGIAEIVDAEAERPLGAGARHGERRDAEAQRGESGQSSDRRSHPRCLDFHQRRQRGESCERRDGPRADRRSAASRSARATRRTSGTG